MNKRIALTDQLWLEKEETGYWWLRGSLETPLDGFDDEDAAAFAAAMQPQVQASAVGLADNYFREARGYMNHGNIPAANDYFVKAFKALEAYTQQAKAEAWDKAIEAAGQDCEVVAVDWNNHGMAEKFYASEYLVKRIRALPNSYKGKV